MNYSDTEIDFGNILVTWAGDNKLALKEVKQLTKAETVKKLTHPKFARRCGTPVEFLYFTLEQVFSVLNYRSADNFTIYTATGSPVTTMLSLRLDGGVLGLCFTPDELRECFDIAKQMRAVLDVRGYLDGLKIMHGIAANAIQSAHLINSSIDQEVSRFAGGYGDNELQQLGSLLKKHMKNRW